MRYLKKVRNKKRIEDIKNDFFVFDVETTKLEPIEKNFVFGVIYGYKFKKVIYSVENFKKEFNHSRYKGKIIFAHNAEFDLLTIFGNIYDCLDNKAIFNGKFISAKLNKVTFADSLNIFPFSLKKIGETIGIKKFENEKISGEKLTTKNITSQDIRYCTRDCKIIFNALLGIFESIGVIKITLASLSMYHFRNQFLTENITFSELTDEFYESYYGGRTEVFKLGKCKAKCYDINQLYSHIMSYLKFPDIRVLKKETKVDVKYLMYCLKYYEGLAKIKVKHKEVYFGFLPYRTDKLLFPVGIYTTIINFNEIRFALKYEAIEILECEYIVYAPSMETPFKEFIKYHYDNRLLAISEKDDLKNFIHKYIPHSLYGRWAMRMKYETTYYNMIPYEIIEELEKTEKFHILKTFSEVREDCFLITENEKFINSFFAVPTFSSYITSEARIILLKGLLDNEKNGVLYCDTDSIFIEQSFTGKISNLLGDWKLEEKNITEIRGLKNYVYINEKGETLEAIKGVSKNAKKVGKNIYESKQYFKTKESLRRNVEAGTEKTVRKKISGKYDKRIVLKDGNTKSIELSDM
ncbi:MAG TPA: DNA polymerase [Candidatus Paceibacterota bacterium]|nr:DNA polymerase [Candidatus Paceibacterota bacterium]